MVFAKIEEEEAAIEAEEGTEPVRFKFPWRAKEGIQKAIEQLRPEVALFGIAAADEHEPGGMPDADALALDDILAGGGDAQHPGGQAHVEPDRLAEDVYLPLPVQ